MKEETMFIITTDDKTACRHVSLSREGNKITKRIKTMDTSMHACVVNECEFLM